MGWCYILLVVICHLQQSLIQSHVIRVIGFLDTDRGEDVAMHLLMITYLEDHSNTGFEIEAN